MKKGLILISFFFFYYSTIAQDWVVQYQNSVDHYQNLELRLAKESAESALQIYKTTMDPDKNISALLRQLAIVCFELGESDLAIKYGQEEVVALQELRLDYDLNFAYALQNLAVIRMSRSEYGAAEPLLLEALKIGAEFLSEDSFELANLRGNLAITLFNLKKDEEAIPLFEGAIQAMEQLEEIGLEYYSIIYSYSSLLAEHSKYDQALAYLEEMEEYYSYDQPNFDYGSIEIKIGDALDQLGRFQEAVNKYQQALDNFKSINEVDAPEYAIALNNLSIELQKIGKYDQAYVLMDELMVQKAATKDTAPLEYATALTNYANLLIRNGESTQAKAKLSEVIELFTQSDLDKGVTYVNALESLSGIELEEGNYQEAAQHISQAISLAEEKGFESKSYSLLNQQAKIFAAQGKFEEAKKLAEKAVEKSKGAFGDAGIQTAYVKNSLAGILTQLGEYKSAEALYLDVMKVFTTVYGSDHPETAKIIANYSSLLQLMGNYYTAENYLIEALEIKKAAYGEENSDYLTTYENLALLYQNTARYTSADRILTGVLSIKERITNGQDPSLAYTYTNLGSIKKQLAEYTEAEMYFKKAMTIYKNTLGTSHVFYAGTINSAALLYQKMGNLEAARPLFEEALAIYEKTIGKLTPDYATALENLATLNQMEEKYDQAKSLLEEALAIDEQILGTDHPLYSKTLHNLASIYEENEEFDRAKELYQKALAIDARIFGVNHPSYASTLYNLAVLEQEVENYDQAKANFKQVVDIRKLMLGENHPDYTFALYGYAAILHKTDNLEEARAPYHEVTSKYLEYIEKYFPALSESEKSAFYSRIQPVFENYMDYAIEFIVLNKGSEADRLSMTSDLYDLQLATKALLLNASNKVRNRINSSGDAELIALFNEWIALKENIVKAYSMTKEELEKGNVTIAGLEGQANEVEKTLSIKSNAFAGEFEKGTVRWKQVRDALAPGEVAIEVIRIKKKLKTDSVLYVGLLIKPGDNYPVLALNAKGILMENAGFKGYKNSIMYKVLDKKSYALFWQEIDNKIGEAATVYLSADGVLNKVNVATLFNTASGKYIVENYNIRLLSNTRELVTSSAAKNQSNVAEIFGFPKYNLGEQAKNDGGGIFADEGTRASAFGSTVTELPGTLVEINNIEGILNSSQWEIHKFSGAQATEAQVKKLESPKILHIATHGFFLEDITLSPDQGGTTSRNAKFNPLLRSGLLFAGAENTMKNEKTPGTEDGILTAYEAMNLNLDNTELVVMSACETGLGEVKNGEGVYGLQRSFMVAGADNLIMSLWKVNDETTQLLMSSFYKNWFSGKSKLDAFNLAVEEVRSKFKDPYYWGAFVILGK